MPAPKGNQFWKARTKHGRDKIFADSGLLWDACCEYFEWVEENPLLEEKLFAYQGEITTGTAHKMRAMTMEGMCIFLGIGTSTWADWRKEENDFSEVVTRAESVMRSQKFAGAAAELLNPNIIARDLGLADKREEKHEVNLSNITDEELDRRIKALQDEIKD